MSVYCTNQMFIKDSKLTTVYSDNGILYNTQNEWTTETHIIFLSASKTMLTEISKPPKIHKA